MPFKLLINFVLVACLSVFTAACGGGGGGGSETPSTDLKTEPAQNTLLPLVSGTSLNYNDNNTAFSPELFDSSGDRWIYKVSYGGVSHYFSSTTDSILLHGIDGTFVIDDGVEISDIRFEPPIPMLTAETESTPQFQVNDIYGGIATLSIDIGSEDIEFIVLPSEGSNIRRSSTWIATEANTWIIKPVPTKAVTLDLTLKASIDLGGGYTREETMDLDATFHFAEGLGIITQHLLYSGITIENPITLFSLTNLPHPIRFESDNLSISVDNNNTFRFCEYDSPHSDFIFPCSSSTPLNSTAYSIENQNELSTLGWINVQEDIASQTFNVTLSSNQLPAEDTSVAVIFKRLSDNQLIPANVTLTVSD